MIGKFIDAAVGMATQPIRDGLEIIDGLREGELREWAALRFGADVAAGMALSELIEAYETIGADEDEGI